MTARKVPGVVWMITGARNYTAACTTPQTISAFSTLKAPTAYPPAVASDNSVSDFTNMTFLRRSRYLKYLDYF